MRHRTTFEFCPRDETLRWAEKVIEDNPGRRVIILTHGYMNWDGTRTGPDEDHASDIRALAGGNYGEEIWDKLVKKHENIFLVLSGHVSDVDCVSRF